jgi:single-stranded-DNA-specific exonuclease
LAEYCESLNAERQQLDAESTEHARKLIEKENRQDDPAIILASSQWHGGIVGIVAGRIAEQFSRPALIITLPSDDEDEGETPGDHAKLAFGSGRTIPGVPLHEGLAACSAHLIGHGGHAAAAGFRLLPEKLPAFREAFCSWVAGQFPAGLPTPELVVDVEAPLCALTVNLIKELDLLEPYGSHNRKPLFLAGGLQLDGEPKLVGQGQRHLSFRVKQGTTVLKAIAWSMAERLPELLSGDGWCSLVFTPKKNEWQGRVTVDLEVTDFQAGKETKLV